jgi:hypothetical protein
VYVGCEVAQVAETALCTIAMAGHCVGEKFSHSRWEAEMYGANFRDPEKGRFGCHEHFDSGPRSFRNQRSSGSCECHATNSSLITYAFPILE